MRPFVENAFVQEIYRGCRLGILRPSSQGSHSYHMALVCSYGVCTSGLDLLLLAWFFKSQRQLPREIKNPKELRKPQSTTYRRDNLLFALIPRRTRDPKDVTFGMLAVLEKQAKKDWKYRTILGLPVKPTGYSPHL
jgi:hypothetical protein